MYCAESLSESTSNVAQKANMAVLGLMTAPLDAIILILLHSSHSHALDNFSKGSTRGLCCTTLAVQSLTHQRLWHPRGCGRQPMHRCSCLPRSGMPATPPRCPAPVGCKRSDMCMLPWHPPVAAASPMSAPSTARCLHTTKLEKCKIIHNSHALPAPFGEKDAE